MVFEKDHTLIGGFTTSTAMLRRLTPNEITALENNGCSAEKWTWIKVSPQIDDNVYISNVTSTIQDYRIEDNVVIHDIHLLAAEANAQFDNGVRVSELNEAGGREVTLFNELNAQIALPCG